jgi:serine phosphatase RsbU (regulator of sigma subunit)
MGFYTAIDYLVNPKDKQTAETHRKGRFFVISYLLFSLVVFLGQAYLMVTGFGGDTAFYGNLVLCVVIILTFFLYRYFGQRVLLVNVITVMGYMSNYTTYMDSGGIYSSDLVTGIVVCSWVFLVANKKSGLFWFALTTLTIIFFFIAEVNGWSDFRADAQKVDTTFYFVNYLFGALFLATVITLHENNKEKYLKELTSSKAELESKKLELEHKNKDVTDSINYAKKIQYAVLPHEEAIYRSIPLSFIYYVPKDIVSGDFFWFHEIDRDNYIIVSADCTGHGVPGAFMTVIASSLLNQIVIEDKITKPSEILSELDRRMVMTLKQEKEKTTTVQDGADLSLLKVNKATKELIITSAKRPAVFIRNKQMQDLKGSKFSIGGMRTDQKIFDEIKLTFQEDDVLYFFTDGYTDQFGGEKGKKFSSKRLKEYFLSIHHLPISEQKQKLDDTMKTWRGELEQVDDILVMGIKL